jgi:hypothetical protein
VHYVTLELNLKAAPRVVWELLISTDAYPQFIDGLRLLNAVPQLAKATSLNAVLTRGKERYAADVHVTALREVGETSTESGLLAIEARVRQELMLLSIQVAGDQPQTSTRLHVNVELTGSSGRGLLAGLLTRPFGLLGAPSESPLHNHVARIATAFTKVLGARTTSPYRGLQRA